MKKIKLIAFSLIMTLFSTALIANVVPKSNDEKMTTEISKLLMNPDGLLKKETKVMVTFTVNKANEIVVLSIDGKNETLKNYIKSRLNYKKLNSKAKAGNEYYIPVRFTE